MPHMGVSQLPLKLCPSLMNIYNITTGGHIDSIKQFKAGLVIFRTLSITYGTEKYPIVATGLVMNNYESWDLILTGIYALEKTVLGLGPDLGLTLKPMPQTISPAEKKMVTSDI
jgi:hypothetical protein